jgi:hypothetical protein
MLLIQHPSTNNNFQLNLSIPNQTFNSNIQHSLRFKQTKRVIFSNQIKDIISFHRKEFRRIDVSLARMTLCWKKFSKNFFSYKFFSTLNLCHSEFFENFLQWFFNAAFFVIIILCLFNNFFCWIKTHYIMKINFLFIWNLWVCFK